MAIPTTQNISSRPFTSQPQPLPEYHAGRDLVEYLKDYAREKPEVAMLWCFGIGFVLGWKLKPW
jgi:hypothetical protein